MPVLLTPGAQIPNRYIPNQVEKTAARDAISKLDYADIFRQEAGTLRKSGVMRVDMQGVIKGPPKQHNIQAQKDIIQGHSTVAHANVSETLMTDDPANREGVLRKVKTALYKSLDTALSADYSRDIRIKRKRALVSLCIL
jgi:hypothetical protein